jgi:hypothetical protein
LWYTGWCVADPAAARVSSKLSSASVLLGHGGITRVVVDCERSLLE